MEGLAIGKICTQYEKELRQNQEELECYVLPEVIINQVRTSILMRDNSI